MRLFVAVEITPELAAAARAVIDQLRHRAARLAPNARVTWVAPDRMHLTVAFIGNSDESHTERIRSVLAPPAPLPPFDLTVDGLGAFPRAGQPRVLWAGLARGRESLLRLERVVASRLAEAGIAPAPRAYNPHLTLARVRDAAGLRAAALVDGVSEDPIGTIRIDAFTLFDSRLSSKGPTYVPLQRTPLQV